MVKKVKPVVSASETKRLARLRELASTHRRAERALERAIRAALDRGISVRSIAKAAGLDAMKVWRHTRTGNRRPGLDSADVKLLPRVENGPSKPKRSGK